MADEGEPTLEWHRVLGADELGEGGSRRSSRPTGR